MFDQCRRRLSNIGAEWVQFIKFTVTRMASILLVKLDIPPFTVNDHDEATFLTK